ncbi:hypothetical protein GCK72_002433 [Caenorhabditis remanei]|uniref:RING-type domain-containing protein n=1 Tax=Caenorhabditis remanei TaxID=31234 RepID=A0A6A5HV94_CAERE|nr:hypothetical protein GCK72_002433 [Caenorhabditis remanei]KAF1770614.1 hypothetical protein GCK72_002433 [Caenorhabditis remanei]
MAPTRRSTRRSSRFSLSAVDMEEQLGELRRYEQEMIDRVIAQNIHNGDNQETQLATPQAPGIAPQHAAPIQMLFPDDESDSDDDVAVVIRPQPEARAVSPPRSRVVSASSSSDDGSIVDTGRRTYHDRPIAVTGPRVQSRSPAPNRIRSGNTITANFDQHPAAGPIRRRSSRQAAARRNNATHAPVPREVVRTFFDHVSATRGVLRPSTMGRNADINVQPIVHIVVPSDSSSDEDNFYNRLRVVPIGGVRAPTNSIRHRNVIPEVRIPRAGMYASNDPNRPCRRLARSPVRFGTPFRVGTPVTTWGNCTMCFDSPIDPQGCNRCQQILGCKTCVNSWFESSESPSCPLCRRKWARKPDVARMTTIDKRKTAKAARRVPRRSRRSQVV